MLAKKTSKNQLTIPKEIADAFTGVDYFDISLDGKKIVLFPVKMIPANMTMEGIRTKLEKLGVDSGDVSEAIAWARKSRR